MGVYNPWAEMPRSCVVCDYRDSCPLSSQNIFVLSSYKHDCCPLVEVKAPHGRLGDLDALLRYKGDSYDVDGHLLYAVGTGSIMCAPTIIEAEEKDDG